MRSEHALVDAGPTVAWSVLLRARSRDLRAASRLMRDTGTHRTVEPMIGTSRVEAPASPVVDAPPPPGCDASLPPAVDAATILGELDACRSALVDSAARLRDEIVSLAQESARVDRLLAEGMDSPRAAGVTRARAKVLAFRGRGTGGRLPG